MANISKRLTRSNSDGAAGQNKEPEEESHAADHEEYECEFDVTVHQVGQPPNQYTSYS